MCLQVCALRVLAGRWLSTSFQTLQQTAMAFSADVAGIMVAMCPSTGVVAWRCVPMLTCCCASG